MLGYICQTTRITALRYIAIFHQSEYQGIFPLANHIMEYGCCKIMQWNHQTLTSTRNVIYKELRAHLPRVMVHVLREVLVSMTCRVRKVGTYLPIRSYDVKYVLCTAPFLTTHTHTHLNYLFLKGRFSFDSVRKCAKHSHPLWFRHLAENKRRASHIPILRQLICWISISLRSEVYHYILCLNSVFPIQSRVNLSLLTWLNDIFQ